MGNVNKLFHKEATSKIFVGKWNRYGQRRLGLYDTTPQWSQIVRIVGLGDSYDCYCKYRKCHICVCCHFSVQIKCTPDCRQNVWNLQLLRHLVAIKCDRSSYWRNFSLLGFGKNSCLAWRVNQRFLIGEDIVLFYSFFLLSQTLPSVSDPWRHFLSWRAQCASIKAPHTLLPELQNKDAIRCAALGTEVPGHSQDQLMQTLIVLL